MKKKYKVREYSIAWWIEGAVAPVMGVACIGLIYILLYAVM